MKRHIGGWMAVLLCLLLCACGGTTNVTMNVSETGKALCTQGTFEDTMSEANANIFKMLYGATDDTAEALSYVEELSFYMSTGATAEEIMVARCKDAEGARQLMQAAKDRVEYLKTSFENYVPKELTKLQNPVLRQEGTYVILCISADDVAAEKIIDQQIKK